MALYALADMLADFAERPQRSPGAAMPVDRAADKHAGPKPDIEVLLAEERARTEKAVSERLVVEHETALAIERENHAARIAEINRLYGEEAGARLEAGLHEIEARVTEAITGTVARILAPIVSDEMLKRSIDELAGAIGEALEDADAITIRVSGPLSLFSALAAKMSEKSKYLRHREADGIDLRVEVNGSLMETRLTEWRAIVHEVLG